MLSIHSISVDVCQNVLRIDKKRNERRGKYIFHFVRYNLNYKIGHRILVLNQNHTPYKKVTQCRLLVFDKVIISVFSHIAMTPSILTSLGLFTLNIYIASKSIY